MVASELLEELDAAVRTDVDVEQDDPDGAVRELLPRLFERRGLAHAQTLELEVDPAQEPDRSVVVDDEDMGGPPLHWLGESIPVSGPWFNPLTGRK